MHDLTFKDCCNLILEQCKNEAAKAYADAGLRMEEGGELARVQALYILNNVMHWRGGRSKDVRAYLKGMVRRGR
jgi:hypothetical protein